MYGRGKSKKKDANFGKCRAFPLMLASLASHWSTLILPA